MKLELRKFTKFVDKTFIEGGKEAKEPVLMVSVAFVVTAHVLSTLSYILFLCFFVDSGDTTQISTA